jgi:tetratricopeptide (TPR) repeat protein
MDDEKVLKQRALMLWQAGVRQHNKGEFALAIGLYTRSIEIYPTAEAFTFRGWSYHALGRVDEAIAECKQAIEIDPSFGNPYNDIGAYLVDKGNPDEAIEWLQKAKIATRYEPRHFPYMNLGRIYAAKGMLLDAIAEFDQALRIEPDEPFCVAMAARLRSMLN